MPKYHVTVAIPIYQYNSFEIEAPNYTEATVEAERKYFSDPSELDPGFDDSWTDGESSGDPEFDVVEAEDETIPEYELDLPLAERGFGTEP